MGEFINILGIHVAATNLSLACQTIGDWIKEKKKTYVCIAPVSMIVDCQFDPEYKRIVNGSGMTTPDGMPLVWLGKLSGNRIIQRTYGPDLLPAFCDLSQDRGYTHYFYGGTEKTNELLIANLKARFPRLKVVGSYAPPFRDIRAKEETEIIDRINAAQPDILWVGLGSPKQDYWMFDHRDRIKTPVLIGAGAAFDFIAGTKPQAPKWMQRNGLEWFFRLCHEPRRLWKRYLFGNTIFIYLLIKERFSRRKARQSHAD